MSFSKILHGIQSGNAGDLDTARPYISKFRASGQDPSLFSCARARHLDRSEENRANLYIFHLNIFLKVDCGGWRKGLQTRSSLNLRNLSFSVKVIWIFKFKN